MRAQLPLSAALALLVLGAAAPAFADAAIADGSVSAPVAAAAAPITVVYVYPTSPSTFVPVVGLPSFLVMPGAPLPEVATQVTTTVALPAAPVAVAGPLPAAVSGDLDCSLFAGIVIAPAPDPYGLDRDGDGIGCEPEDR